MTDFRIDIGIDHLIPPNAPITREALPHLSYAVQRIVLQAEAQWKAYASGAPLPDGSKITPRTGSYLRSIKSRQLGDFSGEVYSDAPHAGAIEEGSPPRDLKRMLNTSMKVRRTKEGKRYLIIPFQHGAYNPQHATTGITPTGLRMMPQKVQAMWRKMDDSHSSHMTAMGLRVSGTGAWDVRTKQLYLVPAHRYRWGGHLVDGYDSRGRRRQLRVGGRMTEDMLRDAGVTGAHLRNMIGMVRMRNPGPGTGGAKHSQYLTFRVMSENSTGWKTKAVPGKWPARTVAQRLRPVAQAAFAEAVKQDIARILRS